MDASGIVPHGIAGNIPADGVQGARNHLLGFGPCQDFCSRCQEGLTLCRQHAGEGLRRGKDEADQKLALQYFETALVDYEKALALEPEHPNYLNDTAVMLHYYLDRDLERAKALYTKAAERAQVLLDKKGISTGDRELYSTALRDSKNNLVKLEKGIKTQG